MKHVNREFAEALSRRCQREAVNVLSAMARGQALTVWFDRQGHVGNFRVAVVCRTTLLGWLLTMTEVEEPHDRRN